MATLRWRDSERLRAMHTSSRKSGFGLLAILLSAVGIAPLLNYGLSATSDLIIRDLGIDEAQFGLLATACFAFAAVGNAALGRFTDRSADLRLLSLIFGIAALSMAVAAIPGGYWLLLIAAALSGLAQSFANGVTNRILAQRVPTEQRITWTGVKQSGVQVSQLVGSIGFPLLAAWVGWHGANIFGALLAVILGILAIRVVSSVPLLPLPTRTGSKTQSSATALPKDTSTRFFIFGLSTFGFINGAGVQATNVYLPLFAVRELDFSLVAGGFTAAVAGIIGVSARVGWGALMSRGISAPKLLLLLASMATGGGISFLLAQQLDSAVLLWLAVALHGASALGVSVVLMAALLRVIPASRLGSASGIVTAGQFAGFTLGPVLMGVLVGSSGGFSAGWVAVTGIYLCCMFLGLFLVWRRRNRSWAEL